MHGFAFILVVYFGFFAQRRRNEGGYQLSLFVVVNGRDFFTPRKGSSCSLLDWEFLSRPVQILRVWFCAHFNLKYI